MRAMHHIPVDRAAARPPRGSRSTAPRTASCSPSSRSPPSAGHSCPARSSPARHAWLWRPMCRCCRWWSGVGSGSGPPDGDPLDPPHPGHRQGRPADRRRRDQDRARADHAAARAAHQARRRGPAGVPPADVGRGLVVAAGVPRWPGADVGAGRAIERAAVGAPPCQAPLTGQYVAASSTRSGPVLGSVACPVAISPKSWPTTQVSVAIAIAVTSPARVSTGLT